MDDNRANKKKCCHPDHDYHHHDCHDDDCCAEDPCLSLLRKAAIAEREDILFYLEAAAAVCGELRAEFLEAATDEMRHFVTIMRQIASLDEAQAEFLEEEGLDVLLPQRAMAPKWAVGWKPGCACPPVEEEDEEEEEDTTDEFPFEDDMTAICLLTKALVRELAGVNMYHALAEKADDRMCCRLFCEIMNDEKHHVAEWIAALYELTGEPPEMEEEEDD